MHRYQIKSRSFFRMSKTEMTNKVRELKELKAMADELAAEITAIEDSIKADMTAQDVEEITVDVYNRKPPFQRCIRGGINEKNN